MGISITDAAGNTLSVAGGGGGTVNGISNATIEGGENVSVTTDMDESKITVDTKIHLSNQNLLDNWYFADPINQKGVASGTAWGNGYGGIDRWACFYTGSVKWVRGEGIYLIGGIDGDAIIDQRFTSDAFQDGEKLTISALAKDLSTNTWHLLENNITWGINSSIKVITIGTHQVSLDYIKNYADGPIDVFRVYKRDRLAGDILVYAMKLELGSQQTLAHKDEDGSWVLNDPHPDKALELEKCKRHMVVYNRDGIIGIAHTYTERDAYFCIVLPTTLIKKPTIIFDVGKLSVMTGGYSTQGSNVINFSNININNNHLVGFLSTEGGLTYNKDYYIYLLYDGPFIIDSNL